MGREEWKKEIRENRSNVRKKGTKNQSSKGRKKEQHMNGR